MPKKCRKMTRYVQDLLSIRGRFCFGRPQSSNEIFTKANALRNLNVVLEKVPLFRQCTY